MSMIGPTPLALPSGAPRIRKAEYCCALAALARMNVELRPPITIRSLRLIQNASRPREMAGIGSKTTPNVVESDFSGLRSGLPPVSVGDWFLQSEGAPVAGFGQRIGSRVPLGVTLEACAV